MVGELLPLVPAGNEEHSSTIRKSANNSTSCDADTGTVNRAARLHVAIDGAALSRTVGGSGFGIVGIGITTCRFAAIFREGTRVYQGCQIIDRLILVVVEFAGRLDNLLGQGGIERTRDHEDGQGLSPSKRVPSIGRFQTIVDDLVLGNTKGVHDCHLEVQENLCATLMPCDE